MKTCHARWCMAGAALWVKSSYPEEPPVPHPAIAKDNVAVITGGASGIGLAAATHFAALGMKVCIADIGADRLKEAETKLSSAAPVGGANIMTAGVDVSRVEDVNAL